ncbi:MAG: flavin reductase family protein [Deltaproteobacteria bacterium]|nr:flavin reductase family protein [Deltaproteobacteria bacterium]
MAAIIKRSFPTAEIRRYLEPGPAVLVSSKWKGVRNIMTMGWYTPMEFTPSLIGCVISSLNYSFELIRKSKSCVINLPAKKLAAQVVDIGNCTGREINKFEKFGLTPQRSKKVAAPGIKECFANFECKLYDSRLIDEYNFFLFEVVHAEVAISPKYPQTIHYRGEGRFMLSGGTMNLASRFNPENL